jgi:hypothetical protein
LIRALHSTPREKEKARARIAKEAAKREKLRPKDRWGELVQSYFTCFEIAACGGLRDDAMAALHGLLGECRARPDGRFDSAWASWRTFGSMYYLWPEVERLRAFYEQYYSFVDRYLRDPDLKYIDDVVMEPVRDLSRGPAEGTNLFFAAISVESCVFRLGGTLAITSSGAGLFLYPQAVTVTDQGMGKPSVLTFGDVGMESMVREWPAKAFGQPVWTAKRMPGLQTVRVSTRQGVFDILAVPTDVGTVTSTIISEAGGNPPRIRLHLDWGVPYGGLSGLKEMRDPQDRLFGALRNLAASGERQARQKA